MPKLAEISDPLEIGKGCVRILSPKQLKQLQIREVLCSIGQEIRVAAQALGATESVSTDEVATIWQQVSLQIGNQIEDQYREACTTKNRGKALACEARAEGLTKIRTKIFENWQRHYAI
ncbi:hypothetical protein HON58_02815 [Candidatus Peregrinibacteria bacterium]|jgi:hypothetical protein|nr:hypothetical protein [Candidatus Peregrinibacteria bacterium]